MVEDLNAVALHIARFYDEVARALRAPDRPKHLERIFTV
jgi:hypothetical protein